MPSSFRAFGTPLYVYDVATLRDQCAGYLGAFPRRARRHRCAVRLEGVPQPAFARLIPSQAWASMRSGAIGRLRNAFEAYSTSVSRARRGTHEVAGALVAQRRDVVHVQRRTELLDKLEGIATAERQVTWSQCRQ